MMVKKIILILVSLSIVSVSVLAPIVKAEETPESWYNSSYAAWKDKVFNSPDGEIFGERYTFAQIQWIVYSILSLATGTDLLNCAELSETGGNDFESCVENLMGVNNETTSGVGGNSIIGLASLVDTVSSVKIASGVDYLASSASKLHLIPEASAQGFGFETLLPIQQMWRAFRNMAYSLSIVIILIISFMIMFRVKLNPQTIITVQSALPRLIIILILITFSYAIAGLMIDLSYLVIALVAMLAKSNGLIATGDQVGPIASSLEIAARMWEGTFWPLSSLLVITLLPIIVILGLGVIVGTITTLGFLAPLGMALLILLLVVIVFLLITLFKILWMMIKTSINIILLIIFGPLIILIGGISPGTGGFGMWAKQLLSNIAVFPTLALMGFLGHLIYWSTDHGLLDVFRKGRTLNPFQVVKLIPENFSGSYVDLPVYNPGSSLFSILGGLGIIFMMPKAAELIKSLVQGKPFAGSGIGETATMTAAYSAGQIEKGRYPLLPKIGKKDYGAMPTAEGSGGGTMKEFARRVSAFLDTSRGR